MYRRPAPPSPIEPEAPREFVYQPFTRDKPTFYAAWFKLVVVPIVAGAAFGAWLGLGAGVIALAISAGFAWWRKKVDANLPRTVLRVHKKEISVKTERGAEERYTFKELWGVELESKTIRRVQDGRHTAPGVGFVSTELGPATDVSRIVFLGRDREPLRLSEEYLAYVDAVEDVGKIRVFLRDQGWVPKDERKKRVEKAPEE